MKEQVEYFIQHDRMINIQFGTTLQLLK